MTLKIRIPRPFFPSSGRGLTALATAPAPARATFHAMLTDCMDEWVVKRSPATASPQTPQTPRTPREIATQAAEVSPSPARPSSFTAARHDRRSGRSHSGSLAKAWSWLHSKYALSTAKRLRVSETVSLGEKRFVALVSVEGREFLIGGGSAGISLLSALGPAPSAATAQHTGIGPTEDAA